MWQKYLLIPLKVQFESIEFMGTIFKLVGRKESPPRKTLSRDCRELNLVLSDDAVSAVNKLLH